MFISIINIRGCPPFFSHTGALFGFVENVECHLRIVDLATYSDPACLSQQLNHFYHRFVRTNAEFDVNTLFFLRIYNLL